MGCGMWGSSVLDPPPRASMASNSPLPSRLAWNRRFPEPALSRLPGSQPLPCTPKASCFLNPLLEGEALEGAPPSSDLPLTFS